MPIPLKVAMQGGGAKLVTLVAAADVLEDLVNEGAIEIREISGTSAGAIAACMLAYNKPVAELKTRMEGAGNAVVEHFGELPGKVKSAYRIARGIPLLPEEQFRVFLRKIFHEYPQFADLSIDTRLVVSDLRNREKRVFFSGDKTQDKLDDVVVHSCALPLVFRTHNNTDFLVDGGLCSNFPTEQIIDSDDDCQTLGFSFAGGEEKAPTNILSYLGALASTAIESSVEENAKRLREAGGTVCELPNDYSTLEFAKALTDLEVANYGRLKQRVRNQITPVIAELGEQHQRREDEFRKDKQLSAMHRSTKRLYPYQTVSSVMHIIGTSLNGQRRNDRVMHKVCFRAEPEQGGEIFGVRMGLIMGDPVALFQDEEGLRVEGPDGTNLAFKSSLVQEDGGHYVIIFLEQPVSLAAGELLTVEMRSYQKDALAGLRESRMDWVRSMCRQRFAQVTGDIVIEVPEDYSLILEDLQPNVHVLPEKMVPSQLSDMEDRWCAGAAMSDAEMDQVVSRFPEPGFERYGWRATDIPSAHFYGVLVTRR